MNIPTCLLLPIEFPTCFPVLQVKPIKHRHKNACSCLIEKYANPIVLFSEKLKLNTICQILFGTFHKRAPRPIYEKRD
jgi:hypothetical protein